MKLIGRYLSPFVRRVATTLQWVNQPYEHLSFSPAKDADAIRGYNPMNKVPALVMDNGEILVESAAILDSVLETIPGQTLLPAKGDARRHVLQHCGVMTSALDKSIAILYERTKRPAEKVHQPFLDGLIEQAQAGVDQIEKLISAGKFGSVSRASLADITAAVGYTFISTLLPEVSSAERHPKLAALAAEFESTPAFKACPIK